MVASVVKKNGMLATKQNIVIGWGMPAFIVLFNMCFEYDNYGGTYHCWLQMDKGIYHCIIITFIIELYQFWMIDCKSVILGFVKSMINGNESLIILQL